MERINVNTLRDPAESTAWNALAVASIPVWLAVVAWIVASYGAGLVFIGIFYVMKMMGERFAAAWIKSSGIRVSELQLPEIHRAVVECSGALGMQAPEVYVVQNTVWNAFATKLAGRKMVVLMSGIVDSMMEHGDEAALRFVVGHELGHLACGHVEPKRTWVLAGGWLPWLVLWYKRRCEFTCDRVGTACTDRAAAIRGLGYLAGGATAARHLNLEAVIAQWESHRSEFFVKYRTIYSTHPPTLWRIAEASKY
ncbi:MAG: M48 family metallopeptidase [Deltaproteobacteria bacterium]|nr:M48 family metallopeptidase [Deltaproteobacteria bacterium]